MAESQSAPQASPDEKHRQMMLAGIGIAVIVRSDTGKTSLGQVRIQEWDKKARTSRAAKFWIYCWGLSLLSVIIPIAHFFLVPGFLLAGPVGAWIFSTQSSSYATSSRMSGMPLPDSGML